MLCWINLMNTNVGDFFLSLFMDREVKLNASFLLNYSRVLVFSLLSRTYYSNSGLDLAENNSSLPL